MDKAEIETGLISLVHNLRKMTSLRSIAPPFPSCYFAEEIKYTKKSRKFRINENIWKKEAISY